MRGALSLSTPVAYSLGGGRFTGIGANTSYDGKFRSVHGARARDFGWESNGSASLLAGISTPAGDLTVSTMIVSGAFENSYGLLLTPKQREGKVKFAVGAQGLLAAGGLGPGLHDDADRGTSVFGVATAELGKEVYVSAGIGTSRFRKGFANASFGLGNKARATIEHDGYGWNYGVGVELASVQMGKGRTAKINGFLGMVQTRYAFWAVGFSL
jgi:hypothetical protein